MAAVLGFDSIAAIERDELVDAQPRVVRVANVFEGVYAAPRHPWNKLAVEAQMELEPIREVVVPGHYVRHECAPLERRRDPPRRERR